MTTSLQLIVGAPATLEDLAGWLAELAPDQRRLCGLAAVFGAVDSEVAAGDGIDVESFKKCVLVLHGVGDEASATKRRRPGSTSAQPGPAADPPPAKAARRSAKADKSDRDDAAPSVDVLADLLKQLDRRCPSAGDAVKLSDVEAPAPKWLGKLTHHLTTDRAARLVWILEKRKVEGLRGSPPWVIVRR